MLKAGQSGIVTVLHQASAKLQSLEFRSAGFNIRIDDALNERLSRVAGVTILNFVRPALDQAVDSDCGYMSTTRRTRFLATSLQILAASIRRCSPDACAGKYGGCGSSGFQSYSQLEATYGIQDAAAITGYCWTWVPLQANDTPTAKHISENLGQVAVRVDHGAGGGRQPDRGRA